MTAPDQPPEREDSNIVTFRAKRSPEPPKPDPDEERSRVRSNVAALIFAALLVLLGWLLVKKLGENARMEDCLMSGRTNCNPIAVPRQE